LLDALRENLYTARWLLVLGERQPSGRCQPTKQAPSRDHRKDAEADSSEHFDSSSFFESCPRTDSDAFADLIVGKTVASKNQ
jgi:hypothetical protein